MRHGSVILGYHGCDRTIGESVLAGKSELRISTNDYDWLGHGGYFWEDDPLRALAWARLIQRHGKKSRASVEEPFVIGAVIEPGNCLDLLQAQSIRLVDAAYKDLQMFSHDAATALPANVSVDGELVLRRLDCAVIQHLHRRREESGLTPFDTVRAAFPEGRPLYPGAGFQEHTHLQICVRNPAQIIGYFRVRGR